ncbi:MAG: cereblon family protein [Desulfobacula sp.]|jgi:hypothetical protein|nr:cereblon family protein [Desulfobacula sp.]
MDIVCKESLDYLSVAETKTDSKEDEIIVCAFCSHPITTPSKQILIHDGFRHIFANPHGYVFEIGCFSEAMGCRPVSNPSAEFSWFIGYSWQTCICSQCATHLGWFFSSESDHFWGLILEKLVFP